MLRYTSLCVNHLRTQASTFLFKQTNLTKQQTRNTYILRRLYKVPLYKKNQQPPPLKSKYYIYELVENTVTRKQPLIDLILLDTIENVGLKGEIISVKSERAYNTLLLPKLAVYATLENIKKYAIDDTETKKDMNIKSSKYIDRTLNLLSQQYLLVEMSMHTPWTIEKWHIKASFRKAGFIVPEDAITLPERTISGPDLLIQDKEFYVIVKINNCEETKVRCKLHHWISDLQNQIRNEIPIWNRPNVAIFPEDQPILDSLPKHRLYKETTNDI
ncbi:mitochondrial ribosomal protein L9 [Calliopsis andreniformis]|uniref:mitochondrial ribosomal protein L9 n=1 Tax=Calliopsis andreniformis TaxID=337506 RepID=UPI003FCDE64B